MSLEYSLSNPLILEGKIVAEALRNSIKEETAQFTAQFGRKPRLTLIQVGDDPASSIYVASKHKACQEDGIDSLNINLPVETTQEDLLKAIDELNNDTSTDAILIQLPLPDHINEDTILRAINPIKDADCFHPYNVGLLAQGKASVYPCTPAGCLAILDHYGYELKGKHAVIIGRSNIVGKPLAFMLLARHATVTICHSRTQNLTEICQQADVLIAAIGRTQMVDELYVKPGAWVIDVGINRLKEKIVGTNKIRKRVVGDVNYERVINHIGAITPVPGGVGLLTIAQLLNNTVELAKRRLNHSV